MRVGFCPRQAWEKQRSVISFAEIATKFAMDYKFNRGDKRTKVLLMVSRFGHCLNDLLYRWKIGALPVEHRRRHLQPLRLPEGCRQPRHPLLPHQGDQGEQAAGRGTSVGSGRTVRRRADRSRPLHAGSVGRRLQEDVGPHHQHPPARSCRPSRVPTPTNKPSSAV